MQVVLITGAISASLIAAELEPRTSRAYGVYLDQARQTFLARVSGGRPFAPSSEAVSARPGQEDGIISVPGGLVHHWVGSAFVRGATLRTVLDVSRAYPLYSELYESVLRSTLLGCERDTYRVLLRLKEGEGGVKAVLDVRSTIRYFFPADGTAYVISDAEEIREVKNAGEHNEQRLPPGRDSGFLWRVSTFLYFVQMDGGVYAEMETLGLSRRFPPLLGWLIEPIARRVGRRSVERTLRETAAAVAEPSIVADSSAQRRGCAAGVGGPEWAFLPSLTLT